jgi:hypothetical protein
MDGKPFPYREWIQKSIAAYDETKGMSIRGRKMIFTKQQYLAALLQGYFGNLSLQEIADKIGMDINSIRWLRTEADFMLLVDWGKRKFAEFFREHILINDFTPSQYDSMAAEFSMLEELLQMQIRVPLYSRLREVARRIESAKEHKLRIRDDHLRFFAKLYKFFLFIEKYKPGVTSKVLQENYKPLADSVVWPDLEEDPEGLYQTLASRDFQKGGRKIDELRRRVDDLVSATRLSP